MLLAAASLLLPLAACDSGAGEGTGDDTAATGGDTGDSGDSGDTGTDTGTDTRADRGPSRQPVTV